MKAKVPSEGDNGTWNAGKGEKKPKRELPKGIQPMTLTHYYKKNNPSNIRDS